MPAEKAAVRDTSPSKRDCRRNANNMPMVAFLWLLHSCRLAMPQGVQPSPDSQGTLQNKNNKIYADMLKCFADKPSLRLVPNNLEGKAVETITHRKLTFTGLSQHTVLSFTSSSTPRTVHDITLHHNTRICPHLQLATICFVYMPPCVNL